MKGTTMKNNPMATLCRWSARIVGTLLVVLVLVIAIGEGMPNPFTQPLAVQIGFLALALIVTGIVAGWRWEFSGGILSTAGWCLFVGSVVGVKRLNLFIALLALPGILYLLSALLRRHDKRQIP
jgi:hypothetical protein